MTVQTAAVCSSSINVKYLKSNVLVLFIKAPLKSDSLTEYGFNNTCSLENERRVFDF